jgi:hypothetical protein
MKIFGDLGLTVKAFQCAFAVDYRIRLIVFNIAPAVVFFVVLLGAYTLFEVYDKYLRPPIDADIEGREVLWEGGLHFRLHRGPKEGDDFGGKMGGSSPATALEKAELAVRAREKQEARERQEAGLREKTIYAAWFSTMLVLPASISALARAQLCAKKEDGGFLIDNPEECVGWGSM